MPAKPVFMPIRSLGDLIKTRQVSPVELTRVFLDRLRDLGPKLNAVVTLTRDLALQQARQAEEEIASGRYRGPLHGIPYGAKDLLATSGGIPTTWGAACFRDRCFDYDATVIRKLREAGAILVAKLAMVEMAGGMGYRQPNASFTGPGVNPWDLNRWSGGSSCEGDRARRVMARYPAHGVELDDPGVLFDVDTASDLEALRQVCAAVHSPQAPAPTGS